MAIVTERTETARPDGVGDIVGLLFTSLAAFPALNALAQWQQHSGVVEVYVE
jgi:hypothetical protein